METVFKEICGYKKKFISFPRLIKAYLRFKNDKKSLAPDTKIFFSLLMNEILKIEGEVILKAKKSTYKVYKSAPQKNRSFLSKVAIVSDKDDVIKGLKLEYDDFMKINLYKKTEDVFFSSELELGVLTEETQTLEDISEIVNNANEMISKLISEDYGYEGKDEDSKLIIKSS